MSVKVKEEVEVNKKRIISSVVIVAIVVAIIAMFWFVFIYPEAKAKELKNELDDGLGFKQEVKQIGNNTALLFLTIELPKEFDNSNGKLEAKVTGIKDSFNQNYGDDLFLGTYEDLIFIQNGNKLENRIEVPAGERLSVSIKIYVPIHETTIIKKTIEVIT
jgi:hypothetical protein